MNTFTWMSELVAKLHDAFGTRVAFIGLQGSRARGEAHGDSDIDVVVLLDSLSARDLDDYHGIIGSMPHSELACGFVGSYDVLASWPRHELFQFYNDTVPIYGELPSIAPFTKEDALQAALIGASGIYHAACHALVFGGDATPNILNSLFKEAFFILQALQFARTGAYPRSRAELSALLDGDDALMLQTYQSWDTRFHPDKDVPIELGDLLIRWAENIVRSINEEHAIAMNLEPHHMDEGADS